MFKVQMWTLLLVKWGPLSAAIQCCRSQNIKALDAKEQVVHIFASPADLVWLKASEARGSPKFKKVLNEFSPATSSNAPRVSGLHLVKLHHLWA